MLSTKARYSLQDESSFMGRALKAEKGAGDGRWKYSSIVFPKYSGLDEYLAIPIMAYAKLSFFMNLNLEGKQIQLHFVLISYNEIKHSVGQYFFFNKNISAIQILYKSLVSFG